MHLFFQHKNSQLPLKPTTELDDGVPILNCSQSKKTLPKLLNLLFPSTLRNSKSLTRNYKTCFQQTARRSTQKLESSGWQNNVTLETISDPTSIVILSDLRQHEALNRSLRTRCNLPSRTKKFIFGIIQNLKIFNFYRACL